MTCMAFAPDGKTLAIGDHHGDVYLWDTVTGKELHRFARHNGQVKTLALSPNGKLLATAGADQTVQLWDLQKREHRWTFRGHRKGVLTTLFAPDGKYLLSGGADGAVCIWDVAREELAGVLNHTFQVGALALSADGRVLTVSGGNKVQQWEATPRR